MRPFNLIEHKETRRERARARYSYSWEQSPQQPPLGRRCLRHTRPFPGRGPRPVACTLVAGPPPPPGLLCHPALSGAVGGVAIRAPAGRSSASRVSGACPSPPSCGCSLVLLLIPSGVGGKSAPPSPLPNQCRCGERRLSPAVACAHPSPAHAAAMGVPALPVPRALPPPRVSRFAAAAAAQCPASCPARCARAVPALGSPLARAPASSAGVRPRAPVPPAVERAMPKTCC